MLYVVVDGFFGDTGKGKITAYLAMADKPALCVRTGAPNAGHTVVWNGEVTVLRSLPTCFVNPGSKLAVAPGALIKIDVFLSEVRRFGEGRSYVDYNTGVIEDVHLERERRDEFLMKTVGSTGQGVGAAMVDRVLRRLRLAREFEELKPYLADVPAMIHEHKEGGVVIEGTQGTFLSLYHGTYPYVTSRDVTASGVLSEAGVGPKAVDHVVLVFKAYVTRVGNGPLPGELPPEEAERRGWAERGAVTGRPRRAAPFNMELAKRAVLLNTPTQIAITKIDVLFKDASGKTKWADLPPEARRWIEEVEEALGVPVTLIGTGPEPHHMVDLRKEKGI
ncbi:adenylosuccinate synthetase [Pyrobaculum aerophilum]|uniref:Adenylosuccinate synthetase n=1 Tax=Pyrobaculum aerophilum TaxID=13773 RepID=A0A371R6C3_9CREN|nr:adenylosuccinate synthetase [Pyrobaculum aerophilum]RFA98513.1 adenylosuccinate synthetase [Pyrobaculum aerophilum]RFB00014.1 adenylosuccinate synthetase [Pyrobaculum aerophilum]